MSPNYTSVLKSNLLHNLFLVRISLRHVRVDYALYIDIHHQYGGPSLVILIYVVV
jgi:hypothetical protein